MKIIANELLAEADRTVSLELLAARLLAFFARRAQKRRLARNHNTAHKLARMGLL